MSHTLNIKINDSAYKKLKKMMHRKQYPNLGDLIAYLVKQENRRFEQDRLDRLHINRMSAGCPHPGASAGLNIINNKEGGKIIEGYGTGKT